MLWCSMLAYADNAFPPHHQYRDAAITRRGVDDIERTSNEGHHICKYPTPSTTFQPKQQPRSYLSHSGIQHSTPFPPTPLPPPDFRTR